jgi:hypothetical protein
MQQFQRSLKYAPDMHQLGKFGRKRTNVSRYPGVNTLPRSGDEGNLLALHPTVKPVAMIADAILIVILVIVWLLRRA